MPLNDVLLVPSTRGPRGLTLGSQTSQWGDPSGGQVVIDFLLKAILDGHGYQVRLGALTTPVSADVEVTTLAAEISCDSVAGQVIIPARFNFNLEALVGTLPQCSVKMTATASTGGTAFTPLALRIGGAAAATTARAAAAGGVTVVDDAVTTTRLLYAATLAAVGNFQVDIDLTGRGMVVGAGNIYVAVGSVTTGSTYFASVDYLEYTTGQLGF